MPTDLIKLIADNGNAIRLLVELEAQQSTQLRAKVAALSNTIDTLTQRRKGILARIDATLLEIRDNRQ